MKKLDYVYKAVYLKKIRIIFDHYIITYKSSNADGKYELYYNINCITTSNPNTLGIFCFSDLKYARLFIGKDNNNFTILKCIPIKILNINKKINMCISDEELDYFYNGHKRLTKTKIKGTIFCSAIKPIEVINLN